jgi:hypothetical protein
MADVGFTLYLLSVVVSFGGLVAGFGPVAIAPLAVMLAYGVVTG